MQGNIKAIYYIYKSMEKFSIFNWLYKNSPEAIAEISGNEINGLVSFYKFSVGTIVVADIEGINNNSPFLGFHIHEGNSCKDNFSKTGGHYSIDTHPHPLHTGDMPPILNANGVGFLAFFTNRFTPDQIIGRVVVLHGSVDDFTSQPAGNSGEKIACGEIKKL